MTLTYQFRARIAGVCAIILLITIGTKNALAQQTAQQYPQYEKNGIYDANSANTLGAGIYHNTKRSQITTLLTQTPNSDWVALRALIHNLLLTASELTTLHNDKTNESGDDLLTLRMKKLIEFGDYKNAYALFTTIKNEDIDLRTIQTAVIAMMLNGQRAKACLEVKIVLPKQPENSFWQELNAYCTLSLSSDKNPEQLQIIDKSNNTLVAELIKNKDKKYLYTLDTFKDYSVMDLAYLSAQDAIDISQIPLQSLNIIVPKHLGAIINGRTITDEQKLILTAHMTQNGIATPARLINLFETMYNNIEDKERENNVMKITSLYMDAKNAVLENTRYKRISEAFKFAETYGESLLIPFAELMTKVDADKYTLDQIERIIPVFLHANHTPPPEWIEEISEIKAIENKELIQKGKLLTVLKTLLETVDKTKIDLPLDAVNAYLQSDLYISELNNIIENIDTEDNNSDKVSDIYENGFDLLVRTSYTMPPHVLINALKHSSKNQNIAQTVLLANIIAKKNDKRKVYPALLEQIAKAMINIGQENKARQILAQAMLEN